MKIAGMEKLSLVDYDGLTAATIFTAGCNMRCPFCHNSSLVYGNCALIEESEVFAYLEKRKGLLDGVCITGGEPTLQKGLKDFVIKVKNLGYKVKLDTNGTNFSLLNDLIENKLIDYVAMDIKSDKENYAKVCGSNLSFGEVEKSAALLLQNKVQYEFRTTLIKEFHSTKEIENIGKWLEGAEKHFLQKFTDSEDCIQRGFSAIEKEKAEDFRRILSKYIKNVYLRGY